MAGIFVPWLADAARLTGYPVVEVSGWRTRGHGGLAAVEGVVCHHTAGPKSGEYPALAVVRDGRAGLAGPLSQLGIGRSGTVYVIAAGVAYHAGESAWAGRDPDGRSFSFTSLNGRFLGIEAEDDGDGAWTAEQLDCYPRLVAALLHYMRRTAARAAAHREVALPRGRKVDPAGIDMNAFRARVAELLVDPLRRIPRTAAQEDDMFTDADRALLNSLARRVDVGFARDQILTALGIAEPGNAPAVLPPGQTAALVARLDSLRAALDQLITMAARSGVTAEQVKAAVSDALREQLVQVDINVRSSSATT